MSRRALLFAGLALGALLAVPAMAKEGDTFQPFASFARYYDNNLFRFANNHIPEHYSVMSAGLNVDWKPGRQQVIASASKSLSRFDRYTNLDYDGSDYRLQWNWRLGNHWSGQAGATETVTQTSLADLVYVRVNNLVTRNNEFASAAWQFHPRWNIALGAAATTSTNSTLVQAANDYDDTSASATLGYTTPKGSNLRGQFLRVDGEYPNRPPSLFVDRAYSQTEYNLLGDWNMEGQLVAHAKIGYVQRDNGTLSQRNFSGLAGRLSADYYLTGKTMLNWAAFRELANSDDINASYQLITGTSLGAAWLPTTKVTLRASANFENHAFKGDTGFILLGIPQRDEDILGGSLSLSYTPAPWATMNIGLQAGRRDSNIPANDYTFRSVFVSVRADF